MSSLFVWFDILIVMEQVLRAEALPVEAGCGGNDFTALFLLSYR